MSAGTSPAVPTKMRNAIRSLAVVVAIGLVTVAPAGRIAAQEGGETDSGGDPLDASTLTVNVELILDASGSMAELVPGTENQSRMGAAKVAMRDVIDRIPEREGLNVGFRVYGHEGSNQEEDRGVSCRSTELLVPIDGLDKGALLAQVETFEPTGWTPLALALEAAAADFEPGGESVTNAIILVTDGEETCGGDPCAVAGALNAAEVGLTTHVVGFALTPEQQEAVRCVAEEGGGQLFAADDASSLSDAVFSALEQVEVEAAVEVEVEATPEPAEVDLANEVGGYVGGNAFAFLGEGELGELSVVAYGAYPDVESFPIVVRNRTGADVENVQIAIVARADGELIGTGRAQGIQPWIVEDGAVALAYGYFGSTETPEGAEFEFDVSADPAGADEITSARDLVVEEINGVEDGIAGIFANPHDETIAGIIILAGVCFDATGQATAYLQSTTSSDGLEPGDTLPFQLSLGFAVDSCPAYLAAGYGSAE